jgi:hypothetical protein
MVQGRLIDTKTVHSLELDTNCRNSFASSVIHGLSIGAWFAPYGLSICCFQDFQVICCLCQDLADKGASIQTEGATIELHSMELEGFGPYRCAVHHSFEGNFDK